MNLFFQNRETFVSVDVESHLHEGQPRVEINLLKPDGFSLVKFTLFHHLVEQTKGTLRSMLRGAKLEEEEFEMHRIAPDERQSETIIFIRKSRYAAELIIRSGKGSTYLASWYIELGYISLIGEDPFNIDTCGNWNISHCAGS